MVDGRRGDGNRFCGDLILLVKRRLDVTRRIANYGDKEMTKPFINLDGVAPCAGAGASIHGAVTALAGRLTRGFMRLLTPVILH